MTLLLRRTLCVLVALLLPAAALGGCLGDASDDLTVRLCTPAIGSNAGGTLIHVEGRGFESDAAVVFQFSNGTRVLATDQFVASSKVIVARSPEPPAGLGGAVTVEVHSGGAVVGLANGFTYTSLPPTLSAVVPNTGPTTGGTTVTITGSGFLTSPAVTIGGLLATSITRPDPNTITAVTPAGGAGAADVTVVNTDSGTATLPGGFTYVGPPVIGSISPTGGPTVGGTRITITGSGYQSGATVSVGGSAAFDVLVSPTSIICQTPAGSAGTQTVTVTNPDTQSASSSTPGGYTYRGTRLYVAHADSPNNRLMVLDYNDGTGLLSNPTGMSSPASSNGAGAPALASYVDPALSAGSIAEVVYLSNYSSDSVSIFHVSSTNGAASLQGTPTLLTGGSTPRNPALCRIHVTSGGTRVLYVLCDNGYISAFGVTAGSGALSELSGSPFRISTTAGTPSPTDWAISGNLLYVADPGRDLIATFSIASDGTLSSAGTELTTGAGDGAAVLQVWPGGQFLYSANNGTGTGSNAIGAYQAGSSPPLSTIAGQPFSAGTGPLGLAHDGQHLYVANSTAGTAQGFAVNAVTGSLAAATAVATDSAGSPAPSLLKLRSDALLSTLYALNTGTNSIAAFTTGSAGALVPLSGSPTALTGASAVNLWAWGANTVFVLDANGAQVIPVTRNVTTGALTVGTSKSSVGTVAADLLVSR